MYDNPTSTSRALIGLRPRFAKYLTTILHGRYAASNYILIAIIVFRHPLTLSFKKPLKPSIFADRSHRSRPFFQD